MGSQFLPVSDDPTKVLRTKTKGIGTDNYRAPEVNAGIHSYDPSAADIWSLGVTLFFLVSSTCTACTLCILNLLNLKCGYHLCVSNVEVILYTYMYVYTHCACIHVYIVDSHLSSVG